MAKRLIHTALAAEARPIIDRWRFRRIDASRRGSVYHSEMIDACLIVSGTGCLKTASAVSAILATDPEIEMALNIGCAGILDTAVDLGTTFLIHRLTDVSSGHSYHPDILYRHCWRENVLTTYGRPVRGEDDPEGLVDMEGLGFFVAAQGFLPLHRIAVVKVVSDHLDVSRVEPKQVSMWIENQLDQVESLLETAMLEPEKLPELPPELIGHLSHLGEAWRLSETQRHRLNDLALGAFRRGRSDWSFLPVEGHVSGQRSVRERNLMFKRLCCELGATL